MLLLMSLLLFLRCASEVETTLTMLQQRCARVLRRRACQRWTAVVWVSAVAAAAASEKEWQQSHGVNDEWILYVVASSLQ